MDNKYEAINQFLRPIQNLLNDLTICEIMINKPFDVWFKKYGSFPKKVDIQLDSLHLKGLITLLASLSNKVISDQKSLGNRFQVISAVTPGFRYEVWNTPVSPQGPALVMRRISNQSISLENYVEKGTIDEATYQFLKESVIAKRNIIIAGSTGSGKTTFCGSLLNCININERLIVIENVQELNIDLPNVLYLATDDEQGYSVDHLINSALRGLPDRIIIGELRQMEASGFLKAANTGHPGSITTLHANSAKDGVYRLEEMVQSHEKSNQIQIIKNKIKRINPIFIFIKLIHANEVYVSKVTEIIEIINSFGTDYTFKNIYQIKSNEKN
jgi:Flp pilus assembly CpaF family ATPase